MGHIFQFGRKATPELVQECEATFAELVKTDAEIAAKHSEVAAIRGPKGGPPADVAGVREVNQLRIFIEELRQVRANLDAKIRRTGALLATYGFSLERDNRTQQEANVALARRQFMQSAGSHFAANELVFVAGLSVAVREEEAFLRNLPACALGLGDADKDGPTLHPDVRVDSVMPNLRALIRASEEIKARAKRLGTNFFGEAAPVNTARRE